MHFLCRLQHKTVFKEEEPFPGWDMPTFMSEGPRDGAPNVFSPLHDWEERWRIGTPGSACRCTPRPRPRSVYSRTHRCRWRDRVPASSLSRCSAGCQTRWVLNKKTAAAAHHVFPVAWKHHPICNLLKYLFLCRIWRRTTTKRLPRSPVPGKPPERRGCWSRHRRRCPIRCCSRPPRGPHCASACLLLTATESWACPVPTVGGNIALALAPGSWVGSLGAHTGWAPVRVMWAEWGHSVASKVWAASWWELKDRKKTGQTWHTYFSPDWC